MKTTLPIDSLLPECERVLKDHSTLILQASPGSGKTTRLPPFLLKSNALKNDSQIWVLEPRRLAAKFAAFRVAEEEREQLGIRIGYHFRFEKNFSSKTRLLYLTEGMLMRRLVSNPTLQGVSAVILDEFHERHLHTDLSLSFLRHLQKTARPDLKIIVMSATLEIDSLKTFLPEAPVLKLESPLFPVEMVYCSEEQLRKPLSRIIRETLQKAFSSSLMGDCLVFLPGLREIRNCEAELESLSRSLNFSIFCLHGDFAKEEQERALKPHHKRKVVLSTNLAETSLTIPGVNCIIDSGLQRTASYSWWTGIPLLSTRATSKASAIQRAGRAGRTSPGICYRLFTKHDFDTRTPFETPEIRRADLAQTLLELKALGISNISKFLWFESPSQTSLEAAHRLLFQLGALDSTQDFSQLTPVGMEMKDLSLHPRISRFLIACRENGCLESGFHLATLISEGKLESLDAIEQLNRPLDTLSQKLKKQLESTFGTFPSSKKSSSQEEAYALSFSLLTAFPDRVAQARYSTKNSFGQKTPWVEFTLSSGGTASLKSGAHYQWEKEEPYCIALDLQEFKKDQSSSIILNSWVTIKQNWLYELSPTPLQEVDKIDWDKVRNRVTSSSQILIGQLLLEQTERPISDENLVFNLLVREILKTDPNNLEFLSLPHWVVLFKNLFPNNEMESQIVRMQLLKTHLGLGIEVTAKQLTVFLKNWFSQKRTRKEIESPDCLTFFTSYFCEGNEYLFEKYCPNQLTFPNQKKVTIQYALDKMPWVESKLQDLFGLTQAPQICDGRVFLTVHLLAPNYRAVQVTSDLKSFWKDHYPTIRKELSRNYPRHPWPENPYLPLPPRPPKKN